MFRTLKNALSSIRFRNKILLVFVIVLLLTIATVVLQQITLTNRLRFRDTQGSLDLLTEQVGTNFAAALEEQEIRLYNSMMMFDLPLLIRTSQSNGGTADLQLALNQMLSTTSPFDFLEIITPKGIALTATTRHTSAGEVASEASEILNSSDETSYGNCEWHRGENGDIYLLRDIYDTSPLTFCGRIIAHLKRDSLFNVGARSSELEYTFLFFTVNRKESEAEFLFSSGYTPPELIEQFERIDTTELFRESEIKIGQNRYFVSHFVCNGVKTIGLSPLSRVQDSNSAVARYAAVYGVCSVIIGVLILLLSMRKLTRQLDSLTTAMDALARGNLDQSIPVVSRDDIGQLATHFNSMSHRISLLLQRLVQEELLKNQAQFKLLEYRYRSLQTQLNPHFIFNSLEAINAMAKMDGNPELSRSILHISHYFRLITNNMNRQFITVQEELESLEDYAQIHQTIQGSRLSVSFSCSPEAEEAVIPTMSLQPILENALIHGQSGALQASEVSITAETVDDRKLLLSVHDNGPGITPEQQERLLSGSSGVSSHHSGVGLKNIRERLTLLYGNDAELCIRSQPGDTCISISLPLNYEIPIEFDQGLL